MSTTNTTDDAIEQYNQMIRESMQQEADRFNRSTAKLRNWFAKHQREKSGDEVNRSIAKKLHRKGQDT